jgi:hypothetical protein
MVFFGADQRMGLRNGTQRGMRIIAGAFITSAFYLGTNVAHHLSTPHRKLWAHEAIYWVCELQHMLQAQPGPITFATQTYCDCLWNVCHQTAGMPSCSLFLSIYLD